ncbi:peptidoglycan-binding protein [Streptomyces hirsutus]|uniref:peptidoglycan-binding protein n=1 Tax=Streptomyces hirsutus TaxID=35620 RepID=UPI0033200D3F
MSVTIVSRATWGAKPWDGNPAVVPLTSRTSFFVHYDGAHEIGYTGHKVPQAIDRVHRNQKWAGIGYNFVVDQDGTIYEGRGWNLQGAHCPGHNVTGIGVQIAIGGDQKPSAKALAACRALYDLACQKTGRTLAKKGHKDGIATDCPGKHLYAWVKDGMPVEKPKPDPPADPAPPSQKPTPADPGWQRPTPKPVPPFPGRNMFGPGKENAHITLLGRQLVRKGFGKHYRTGPGPKWSDADRKNLRDFQLSRRELRGDADGLPGPLTWKLLFS